MIISEVSYIRFSSTLPCLSTASFNLQLYNFPPPIAFCNNIPLLNFMIFWLKAPKSFKSRKNPPTPIYYDNPYSEKGVLNIHPTLFEPPALSLKRRFAGCRHGFGGFDGFSGFGRFNG